MLGPLRSPGPAAFDQTIHMHHDKPPRSGPIIISIALVAVLYVTMLAFGLIGNPHAPDHGPSTATESESQADTATADHATADHATADHARPRPTNAIKRNR